MGKYKTETGSRTLSVIIFGLICCLLYGLGAGIRCNVGILVNPLAGQYGVQYHAVSFSVAVMQLVFGASQPLFGLLAARRSNRFVLLLGVILLAAGIVGTQASHSYPLLILFLGIVFGSGAGAISFGLVLTSAIHFAGQKNAMLLSGMLNAAAGFTGFILAPLVQSLLNSFGLKLTLIILAVLIVLLVPVVWMVTVRDPEKKIFSHFQPEDRCSSKHNDSGNDKNRGEDKGLPGRSNTEAVPVKMLLPEALKNRTYRLLICGFGTCGFHMVIIESHLFSQFVQYGIDKTAASWAFSVYSLATISGALLSGFLSSRLKKGRLLGFYYGFRAVWTLLFLFLMPKNIYSALVFAVGLGFTGDATVSPTSGIVNKTFRLEYIATLIGFLFLCHQIGAFFSAWLGGLLIEKTGSYTVIWLMDVVLCTFASVMSLRIKDE